MRTISGRPITTSTKGASRSTTSFSSCRYSVIQENNVYLTPLLLQARFGKMVGPNPKICSCSLCCQIFALNSSLTAQHQDFFAFCLAVVSERP